jgi:hypothetical protein
LRPKAGPSSPAPQLRLVLVGLGAAGAFPLPGLCGKAVATASKPASLHLPLRLERVRAFYEAQFQQRAGRRA